MQKDYKVTLRVIEEPASRFIIDVKGNIDYYAKVFLNIYNHVKSYSSFLKMYNYDDNRICVICLKRDSESVKEFLEGFEHNSLIVENCLFFDSSIIEGQNDKLFERIDSFYEETDYTQELDYSITLEV